MEDVTLEVCNDVLKYTFKNETKMRIVETYGQHIIDVVDSLPGVSDVRDSNGIFYA